MNFTFTSAFANFKYHGDLPESTLVSQFVTATTSGSVGVLGYWFENALKVSALAEKS